jgi:hypothetical protein
VGKEDGGGSGLRGGLKQAEKALLGPWSVPVMKMLLGRLGHQTAIFLFRFCYVPVKKATRTVGSEPEFNSCRPIVRLSDKTKTAALHWQVP